LAEVDAFGRRDLGHRTEPSFVQQALPVVREAERPHQGGVLRHLAHLPLTAGLVQELLRRVQRRDDLLLQAPAHQRPGQEGFHLHAASGQRRLIRHRVALGVAAMLLAHASSSKLAMSWRWACQSTIRRFR
jgi:hypothetical protein